MKEDIDLDISSLMEGIPEDNIVFYFRAGDEDIPDFLYAKGDLMDMGATLANLMDQNEALEQMIAHACLCRK